jgi:hypothetical protein
MWAKNLRRRLIAAVVALTGAMLCLMLGSAWIAGMTWNTPMRNPVLASMLGIFLTCTIIGTALAAWPGRSASGPLAQLQRELGVDSSATAEVFPRSTVMRVALSCAALARLFR